MFSPIKNEDKKFLLELAELIEIAVRLNTPESLDLAVKFGERYLALDAKIKTHDYTRDDALFYRIENLIQLKK